MLSNVGKLEWSKANRLSVQASLQVSFLQVTKADALMLVLPLCSTVLTQQFTFFFSFNAVARKLFSGSGSLKEIMLGLPGKA